jgi:hypothetical protein
MKRERRRWEQFERLVAAIHRATDPTAQVKWNDSINGRQFDVTLRFRKGLYDYLTVIECKDYSSAVPVGEVEAFITKSRDASAHQAVMASASGFQSGAKTVAERHNVTLVHLTDSPEIDLSIFGAEWGPDIDAINVQAVALRYSDGEQKNLPEAANAMSYCINHLSVRTASTVISLHDLISQRVQSVAADTATAHDVFAEYEMPLPPGTVLISPDDAEFPSKSIASISLRVALTKAKTLRGPRQFDPALLVPDVDFKNILGGESTRVSRHGLALGTAERFEVGTFYEQPQLSHYYYCDQIVGGMATIYLVESFQLGALFQAVYTQETRYASYYTAVREASIVERLKRRLADMKAR